MEDCEGGDLNNGGSQKRQRANKHICYRQGDNGNVITTFK